MTMAACILHNICLQDVDEGLEVEDGVEEVEEDDVDVVDSSTRSENYDLASRTRDSIADGL